MNLDSWGPYGSIGTLILAILIFLIIYGVIHA